VIFIKETGESRYKLGSTRPARMQVILDV